MKESIQKVLWLLSRRERINALILLFLLTVNALFEVVGIGIVPAYVGMIAYPEKFLEYPYVGDFINYLLGDTTQQQLLIIFSIAISVFFGIKLLFTVFLSYWKTVYINNRIVSLSEQLFSGYMEAPHVFHVGTNMSELIRNINQDCLRVGRNVLLPIIEILTQILVLLAILSLLILASPGAALMAALLFVVVIVVGVRSLQTRVRNLGHEAKEMRGRVMRTVYEGLMGVKEIRLMGRGQFVLSRFHKSLCKMFEVERFMQVLNNSINPFVEWISVMGLVSAIAILYARGEVIENIITTVVLFAVSLIRMKGVISALILKYSTFQHNFTSLDTIYSEIHKTRPVNAIITTDVHDKDVSTPRLGFQNQVVLDNVSYIYPGANVKALDHVDLVIRKGEAIGIVGSTGSGKSTLADIVMGILEPTEGGVLVDDADVHKNLRAWQRDIGFIPQDIYLIDGSIKENIALAIDPREIDSDKVRHAADAAQLMEFIDKASGGLDSRVGDRGVKLSGGQRQRVAIARALYNDPDILVMDEATSALDNQTERSVIDAVSALKGKRTIIMIAHRLTTLASCDRIVVIADGKISAIGTQQELQKTSNEYQKMMGAVV
ncbi:MAG: ABC transporter ATP-binding protein [marine bacterium B5-7]|nr:MAG: ABC transporter ATP-binding protein [marine bacterium B5-7]